MTHKYSTVSLACILAFMSSACSQNKDASSAPVQLIPKQKESIVEAPKAPVFIVENASPDQALKTWWKLIDLMEQNGVEDCKNYQNKPTSSHVAYYSKITQEDMLRSITPRKSDCKPTVFDREILEVKTESETRAIIFAKVFNATPVPEGAEPDEYEKKFRKDGFKFKYLIEKSSEGWKVSQVYEFDKYSTNGESWKPTYKYSEKPHYPSYVVRQ